MKTHSTVLRVAALAALVLAWGITTSAAAEPGAGLPDPGGQRTVTNHDGGGRTVDVRGRSVEPRDLTTRYDAEGRVVEREGAHSDGTVDRMTYDPETGERRSTTVRPDGAITRDRSQADGSSVTVQTGYGTGRVTTVTGPDGDVEREREHPDGSRTVEVHPDGGTSTTTEYGANGRPTGSDSRTPGESRVTTEFDTRGNPVKTEVREDGAVGRLFEDTTYWPGTGVPRRTRSFLGGEPVEVIYYDEQGRETRRSSAEGAYPLGSRWVFDDGGHQHEPIFDAADAEQAEAQSNRAGTPVTLPPARTRPGY